jgi:hypothetical protein
VDLTQSFPPETLAKLRRLPYKATQEEFERLANNYVAVYYASDSIPPPVNYDTYGEYLDKISFIQVIDRALAGTYAIYCSNELHQEYSTLEDFCSGVLTFVRYNIE